MAEEGKRVTIVLDAEDQKLLKELTEMQRLPEAQAIRKAVRLAHQLMALQEHGGKIILQRGKDRSTLQFVP